tara:strand:- start:664 stop:1536 length:873 start_codon:yes stop_codon:yes gene_type:complete
MTKVMFLNNWGESPETLLKRYSAQTPGNRGVWGSIEGTTSFEEADFYIVMDGMPHQLIDTIDWSRVIYFQREPASIRPYFMQHEFPENIFFKGTYESFYDVGIWWINLDFDELVKLEYPTKTKKISSITSGKTGMKEYNNRINFLNHFSRRYDDIDIYGRGTGAFLGDRWKGELNYNGNCKLKGLIDYEYSIVLENTMLKNSWTEKIADSYLCWALPIYSGDSNINRYFPEDSYYNLDIENCDTQDIVNFIQEPPSNTQINALQEARNSLLFKWNIWPSIERVINNDKLR